VCVPGCTAAPANGCRFPSQHGKAAITIKDKTDNTKDQVKWKWIKGSNTQFPEFGNPTDMNGNNGYFLCIYNASVRVSSIELPPGDTCGTKPCWKTKTTGYTYKDKLLTPNGALSAGLKAGADFKASIKVTAKGANVPTPDITTFTTGPIVVQFQREDGNICFEADYSAPFLKNANGTFSDKAD